MNIQSFYERTWLNGETDHVFLYHFPLRKNNGKDLASYATFMEIPDFELPKPKPKPINEDTSWTPIYGGEDMEDIKVEIEEGVIEEELEEGEIVEEPEEGEVCCEDEFENAWRTRGSGNAEDHSILLRMLKEGRLKFKGFRLLVDLHQIFFGEPEYLARVKKVIMYAIHFRIVRRIDFSLWGYAFGDYCSCVPQDLFVKHISPMLRNLPKGPESIDIGYVNTCRPGYDKWAKYTEWECQYTYGEEDVEEFSWLHYAKPEPQPLIEPLPCLDEPDAPHFRGWTPPSSPKPDLRFNGWGEPSWDFVLGNLN